MELEPTRRIACPSAEYPVFQLTGNGRGAFKRGDLQDSLQQMILSGSLLSTSASKPQLIWEQKTR